MPNCGRTAAIARHVSFAQIICLKSVKTEKLTYFGYVRRSRPNSKSLKKQIMHYTAFLHTNWAPIWVPIGLKWVPSHPNVDAQSLGNYAQKITK